MLSSQVLKFISIGALNTIFYYFLYSCFIYFSFDYKLAVLFATLIGMFFSFKTFGKFVFNNNNNNLIYRFILVYMILYLLNILLITILELYFTNYYLSGFMATIICAFFSFIINKYFVFRLV